MTLGLKEQLPTSISSRWDPLLQAWVTKLSRGESAGERDRETERERERGAVEGGLPTAMGKVGAAAASWLTEAQMSPSELNLSI